MDLWRINFKPMTEGGDDVTGALRKVDLNFEGLGNALASSGEFGSRLAHVEQIAGTLGGAATKDVGSAEGTVAAGDDARIVAVASKADKSYVDAGLAKALPVQSPYFTGAMGKHGNYGETCFYVSSAAGERGIGGAFLDWSGSRPAALQVDSMDNTSAYMGLRWTHWGVKHLVGIDAFEGGGTPGALTSLNFHFDAGVNRHVFYSNGNATFAGSLTQNSDYRIKSDVVAIDPDLAANALRSSRPVEYQDVRQPEDAGRRSGFIAHELAENFPLLVEGEKDAVRLDDVLVGDTTPYAPGEAPLGWKAPSMDKQEVPLLQNVNYIGLVPYLCAGWQQSDSRIRSLEEQLACALTRISRLECSVG